MRHRTAPLQLAVLARAELRPDQQFLLTDADARIRAVHTDFLVPLRVEYGRRDAVIVPAYTIEDLLDMPVALTDLLARADAEPTLLLGRDYLRCRYCNRISDRYALTLRPVHAEGEGGAPGDDVWYSGRGTDRRPQEADRTDRLSVSALLTTCESCVRAQRHVDPRTPPRSVTETYEREARQHGEGSPQPRRPREARNRSDFEDEVVIPVEHREAVGRYIAFAARRWPNGAAPLLVGLAPDVLESALARRVVSSGEHTVVIDRALIAEVIRIAREGDSLTPELTRQTWRNGKGVCAYCLRHTDDLAPDQPMPRAVGGPMSTANLVLACGWCRMRKQSAVWKPHSGREIAQAARNRASV